ncbi:RING-H2 zinc finger protein [Quillaja saponaria]|uniref:RING-H2 zinc finger protein n=1 Tax=Quillaja saponaria TaxID=32244 RepID=A0AAD7LK34_QUISA|nr:RING-H2 zinc finger protein [Quillaja saponaria]
MSPPPLHPITNGHGVGDLVPLLHKLPTLPDLFVTAISICFLFASTAKSHPSNTFSFRCPFFSFPLKLNSRRFLKIPNMSHTTSNHKNVNFHRRHNFASPQSLSEWLKPRLPSDSFASWGVKPGTKNIHNLWLELSEGETTLADSTPPVRTVQVVTVRVIGKDSRFLIESHQELSDGNVRKRGRPLSEKMKPNEVPESAAIRAVKEELGSVIRGSGDDIEVSNIMRIDPNSYEMKVEERNSDSYPGLPGCYVLHTLDARVEGLPDGDFCTDEAEEYEDCDETSVADKAVSVKKHYWTWVSADSIKS